jgi:hypothetical protein
LQDIIDEEKRQSNYLRENIFQESPISYVEVKDIEKIDEDKKEEKEGNQEISTISMEELLREEPLTEATQLSEVFDSF